MIYPWLRQDWLRIQQLRGRWPHALLVFGQAGIGEVEFARALAHGLLCEDVRPDGEACGVCGACHWLSQANHPDYREVLPEALAALAGVNAPGAPEVDAGAEAKKTRLPSKEIKIDQVRGLLEFCALGSHRGGNRVVLLHPADALNSAAANALLKTLEEPPAGVIFILVATQLDRLLPTIVSRCRQLPLASPGAAEAAAWLASQSVEAPAKALAAAGGAPLAALALAHDEYRELSSRTLEQLARGPDCDAFQCAEALQKAPVPAVLGWLQRWLYDLQVCHAGCAPRYFPAAGTALAQCAGQLDIMRLHRFNALVTSRRASENHTLNPRLVFEELLFGYRDIFRAKAGAPARPDGTRNNARAPARRPEGRATP